MTSQTKTEERAYIEEQVKSGVKASSNINLVKTANISMNLVANQYGTLVPQKNETSLSLLEKSE